MAVNDLDLLLAARDATAQPPAQLQAQIFVQDTGDLVAAVEWID